MGALREFITLPPHNLFPVPKSLNADGAMLCEPLAVAVHAVEVGGIKGGEKVAVIGCGCLGLQICKLLDLAGAEVVLAVEPVKERRELAPSFGARKAIPPDDDPIAVCRGVNHGRLPDIVYEVAGPADALGLAQELVRPGGTLVYAGIHAGAMEIDFVQSRRKELVWKWVRRCLHGYPAAIDLIARKVIDPTVMVTHHWPLEKIADAHDVALAYGDGIIKGAIDLR
jgi:L-iditol 2-dehydrogenase